MLKGFKKFMIDKKWLGDIQCKSIYNGLRKWMRISLVKKQNLHHKSDFSIILYIIWFVQPFCFVARNIETG